MARLTPNPPFEDATNNPDDVKPSDINGLSVRLLGQNDVIQGTSLADTINGNIGEDIIQGGNGEDSLRGGKDSDVIFGGEGNDTLIGDLSFGPITGNGTKTIQGLTYPDFSDLLIGGGGADRFVLTSSGSSAAIAVVDFTADDFIVLPAGLTEADLTKIEVN